MSKRGLWMPRERGQGEAEVKPAYMGVRPVRLILIGVMFSSLMMSAALPEAFQSRGLSFAIALIAIQVGGPAFVLACIGRGHHLSLVLERLLLWRALSGRVSRSRLVALGGLAGLVPMAAISSALALTVAATLVLIVLTLRDLRSEWIMYRSTAQTEAGLTPER